MNLDKLTFLKGRHAILTIAWLSLGIIAVAEMPAQHDLEWQQQPSIESRFADGLRLAVPLPEYPRPQLVREQWSNLNGVWDFLSEGTELPKLPNSFTQQALVPSATNAPSSGLAGYVTHGWYRRTVQVPEDWDAPQLQLNFEGVAGIATVYWDGQKLGKNVGSYKCFSYVVPDVEPGAEHELLVHFDDREPRLCRGKGDHFSGIWQTVWIEPVAEQYIRSFKQTPDIDAGELLLEVDAPVGMSIHARALKDGVMVAEVRGQSDEALVLKLENPLLWSPESPHLYDLEIELKQGTVVVDQIQSYFGMRSIEVGDVDGVPRFLLNGELYYHIGLLDQTFWPESYMTPPSDEALKFEIEQTKAMGYNTLRKHFKVESSRWYYWCDVLGLLVWQDLPPQAHFRFKAHETEEDKDFQRNALHDMITQLYNHPSIVTWVIFNEALAQFEPRDMTIRARKLDQSRLIDTTSHVWPNDFGRERYSGDFYDHHNYGRTLSLEADFNAHIPSAFGEFGGIAYRVDGHIADAPRYFGYGDDAVSEEDFLFHYEELIRQACALRDSHNMSGIIYTQITDWMGELNGMITCDRKVVKFDKAELRRINGLFTNPEPSAPIPMPAERVVPMPATKGRYVRLELPGDYHLIMINELEVFAGSENVALNSRVSSSSVRANALPDYAIDGRTDDGSVAMTDVQTAPWIELDLGEAVAIDEIRIHNRPGQAGKRLNHLIVRVLDTEREEVYAADPVYAAKALIYGAR